ncbi:hypothetical protein CDES_13485 [Corynebacterium deserti GIMN1.010]|uniref:DUF5318 domain-containing protein n=1 Tax=Corynebacterium deserti GIMN1.010 TaxID=931089 RepID=A0A0M4CI87_9CORY|nr:DUF5318 family protein [Corynebacterium deserti]ALC07027.1 hypothetical protein CDES_13485 [Corynebacterium deserti GIMN1.010]
MVVQYRNEISHQLARRRTLRQFHAGLVRKETICDAEFILVTASKYHGEQAAYPCPVCGSDELRVVLWVYGDEIGKAAGSARSEEEIEQLVKDGHQATVHTVEVCSHCKWNHLLKAQTATAS